jgi:hypothetical protein
MQQEEVAQNVLRMKIFATKNNAMPQHGQYEGLK